MRMRHVSRPRLESMEDRFALSALGAAAPKAEVHTTRLARVEAHMALAAGIHAARHDATATHHHAVKHTTTPSKPTSKSSFDERLFSQFFKSTFGGL